MAKEKKPGAPTDENGAVDVTDVVIASSPLPQNVIPGGDILGAFKKSKQMQTGLEITSEKYEWEIGVEVEAFVIGTGTVAGFNDTSVRVPSVRLIVEDSENEKGYTQVNSANAMLVSALFDIGKEVEEGHRGAAPYVITCTGEARGKNGTYKTFSIKPRF